MRWSESETVKFVKLYRDHECLWNVSSPQYKNKQMKQVAFQTIIKEMGIEGFGVAEVKQKIKNLRCTYNQELLKIDKSKESNAGEAAVYVPGIKWFFIMDAFVRNINRKRSTRSNLSKLDINATQKSENFEDETYLEESMEDIPHNNLSMEESRHAHIPTVRASAIARKKQEIPTDTQELNKLNRISQQPDFDEHECDAFGRYVALNLKKLPLQESLMAQSEIQATLVRYRVAACATTPTDTPSASIAIHAQIHHNQHLLS